MIQNDFKPGQRVHYKPAWGDEADGVVIDTHDDIVFVQFDGLNGQKPVYYSNLEVIDNENKI